MPRPRTAPLPRGITERRRKSGIVYQLNFTDQTGTLRQELAGPDLREAKRLLAQRRQEVREGRYRPGGSLSTNVTIAAYAATWLDEQKARGVRSIATIDGHLRLHIVPALGNKRLVDLRPAHVAEWVETMKREGKLSAKTITNVHGTLHAMLEHARFRELVVANVATLPKGMLPRKSRRKAPRFERGELERLLTDERIDWHRRIFYALQGLGGLRCGEASGRRWRDLDTEAPGLWCLHVATQYEDAPLKTARDEDAHERFVPVHPALAEMLQEWRLRGYAMTYGRPPTPDDWICPDPRTGKPRTREQAGNALYRDLDRLGIPRKVGDGRQGRRTHAFRRAFISLARSDGAIPDHLEVVTHNAAGAVIDAYTSLEWGALCAAVRCLRVDLRRGQVIAQPRAGGARNDAGELDALLDAPAARGGIIEEKAGGVGSRTSIQSRNFANDPAFSGTEERSAAGVGHESRPEIPGRSDVISSGITRVKHHALAAADAIRDALTPIEVLLALLGEEGLAQGASGALDAEAIADAREGLRRVLAAVEALERGEP